MPPATGDEHGLTRVLDALYDRWQLTFRIIFQSLQSWEDEVKILDSFIIFALVHQMASSHKFLGDPWAWRDENPPLVSLDRCIPSRGPQRILMDLTSRALGPDQEPSMWWHVLLSQQLEKIILEVFRRCIILLHDMGLWMLFEAALKKIER
jgi:hypothetical protein